MLARTDDRRTGGRPTGDSEQFLPDLCLPDSTCVWHRATTRPVIWRARTSREGAKRAVAERQANPNRCIWKDQHHSVAGFQPQRLAGVAQAVGSTGISARVRTNV
jgi:hypothetical protein